MKGQHEIKKIKVPSLLLPVRAHSQSSKSRRRSDVERDKSDTQKRLSPGSRKDNNMKVITTHTKVYDFEELSSEAKDTAREWWREASQHDEWWEFVYEDAKNIGGLMGIDIDNIYFSGFWSQGDGANFTGTYAYGTGSVAKVKAQMPKDEELHRIVEALYKFQRRFYFTATARITTSGHYSHSRCTCIDAGDQHGDLNSADEIELTEILRSFMDWIYIQLEKEYDWLNANEQIDETLSNGLYEFTQYGVVFP